MALLSAVEIQHYASQQYLEGKEPSQGAEGSEPRDRELAERDSSALWGLVNVVPQWENHHRPCIKPEFHFWILTGRNGNDPDRWGLFVWASNTALPEYTNDFYSGNKHEDSCWLSEVKHFLKTLWSKLSFNENCYNVNDPWNNWVRSFTV